MNKKKRDNLMPDGAEGYLHVQRIRIWFFVLAAVLMIVGGAVWMFFGSYNITVTGNAQIIANIGTYCFISSTDIDRVKPGMTAWVGDKCSTVKSVDDEYYTYEGLVALYGQSARRLHPEEGKAYYSVEIDSIEKTSGYSSVTIITDVVTPREYFFGGAAK